MKRAATKRAAPPQDQRAPELSEFAQLDLERLTRRGVGEVIFGEGKRPHELALIIERLVEAQGRALATRVSPSQYHAYNRHATRPKKREVSRSSSPL